MEWGLIAALLVIVIILWVNLSQKQSLDNSEKLKLESETAQLRQEESDLHKNVLKARQELNELHKQQQLYADAYEAKSDELDAYFENQRKQRQQELESNFKVEAEKYKLQLNNVIADCSAREKLALQQTEASIQASEEQRLEYLRLCDCQQSIYESLLEPIKLYEKERQDKLFYTIQLPEEFHDDIEFLLTTVALKVQHPDIISKLVWAEYVKPNLDNTFKRIEIKPEPGIYKLTNIDNGMAYIGKSTNVKTRIADHFKSSIGITSIADQAVHHEILKSGFWNWSIEVITYCEKDKLNELEKYYINFFNTQTYGYNKNKGGGG